MSTPPSRAWPQGLGLENVLIYVNLYRHSTEAAMHYTINTERKDKHII